VTPSSSGGGQRDVMRQRERELLDELGRLDRGDPRRDAAREELITMHLPLVKHLARRYRDRGEPWDDLVQVGTIGLIKAIDGFDASTGAAFSSYATPTILGEIKRHFRDHAWAVHVPRRLQELQSKVMAEADSLTARLGRAPTVREIAESLGVGEDEVLEAIEARQAYAAAPLEAEDAPTSVVATLGAEDPALAEIDDRETLRILLASLPERERTIVTLRFFRGMSQTQIAEEVGVSQMHVSRLLARSLATLREGLAQGAGA